MRAPRNCPDMRITAMALLLLATTLAAQTPQPEHGVYVDDIDKKVDACTNFFDYANGAWRAANPIPASMQKWSRRWAAGEQSKDELRTLLDEKSNPNNCPKPTINQQLTHFSRSS